LDTKQSSLTPQTQTLKPQEPSSPRGNSPSAVSSTSPDPSPVSSCSAVPLLKLHLNLYERCLEGSTQFIQRSFENLASSFGKGYGNSLDKFYKKRDEVGLKIKYD
jgi:hypothetical protein